MIQDLGEFSPRIDSTAFIHPQSVVIGQVNIGAHSSIWPCVVLRGDMGLIDIGSYTSIQDGTVAHITRNLSETRIGNYVTVGHRVILHGCIVEDHCLIGMGSILLDNCKIGAGSLVAAGSLVTANKEYPPNSLIMGAPAKVIRPISEKESEQIEDGWQTYFEYSQKYLRI